MTTLRELSPTWQGSGLGFLDASAKREIRRKILKAIALPGHQIPFASREMPIARGWGTGGLQVTLTLAKPSSTVKVIDQGADDGVNATNIRNFIAKVAGSKTTTNTARASLIQSRHRIPEEILRHDQVLVLQVPNPEPLRFVEPSVTKATRMHAEGDYGRIWLKLYEEIVRSGQIMHDVNYPSIVHGRYLIAPSPIPKWDVPKLNESDHITLFSAGREKRLYAIPPHTKVEPLTFSDIAFRVEDQRGKICHRTALSGFFMNESPSSDGKPVYELSDSGLAEKLLNGQSASKTYYKDGVFNDEL